MKRVALVPFKSLSTAKARLAPILSLPERQALAFAMLWDVLSALRAAKGLDEVALVSSDAKALKLAEGVGARTLPEKDIPEVLWHFNLWATRKSREEKTAAHEAAWLAAWQYHPCPAGSRRAYLFEDYPNDTQPIDPWRKYL